MRLPQRLSRLQIHMAALPDEDRWAREREANELAAWERLCACLPESRAAAIVAALDQGEQHWLTDLMNRSRSGLWAPVPIPEAVVDVFLEDPEAGAWCCCEGCGTVLPYRMGFWRRAGQPSFWQGPLYYFKSCPGCGGRFLNWDGRPVDRTGYLPVRPGGDWTFSKDA
jgi:hypothetical protein